MVAEGGEGENPLPFSLTAPKCGGGVGGGVGGVSRLRFPPGPHLRSSRFSRHPRLHQAPTRRFAKNRNLRGLGGFGGPGPKPWGPGPQAPWRPGPQAPGAWIPPLSPINFLQAELRRKLKTLGCYHNPQSADLGERWMVSEGGALQLHERRGSRLCSSISAAGPGAKPLKTWPARIPKMPRCSSAHEKPGLLHRLISCTQSAQLIA